MKFLISFILLFGVMASAETYNCTIFQQADVGATTTSTRILVKDNSRRCLQVQNKGDFAVYIKFNSAHSGTEGVSLGAGASWAPIIIPVNSVYVKSSTGTVNLSVLEGQ